MSGFWELIGQMVLIALTTAFFALVGWLPVILVASTKDQAISSPGGWTVGSFVVPPRLLAFEAATAYAGFSFAVLYFSFGFHFLLCAPAALYQAVCLYQYTQKWINPSGKNAALGVSSKKDDNRGQVEI